jgi:hypothetical protein
VKDVRTNVDEGQFGIWEETGFNLNLALVAGAYEGIGYGEAVGKMITREGVDIPSCRQLLEIVENVAERDPDLAAAALDFLATIQSAISNRAFIPSLIPTKATVPKPPLIG